MASDETMNWKSFTVRLIEALRWPVAIVVIFFLLREPFGRLLSAIAFRVAG